MAAGTRGFARHLRRLCLLAAAVSLPAQAQVSPVFGNGKGVNLLSAVWGKRSNGAGSPAVYQLQPDRWSPALLARVKASNFGFIRLVTTPVPLMTTDPQALDRALSWVASLVDQANAAGLAVIVDMHFWPTDTPLSQDTVGPDPALRAALVRAEAALAARLADKAGRRVALELLNEPHCTGGTGPTGWLSLQRALVTRVRKAALRLPLVLTACRGRIGELPLLDASSYGADRNLYWTFHSYDPSVFTGQDDLKLAAVPFPPDPSLANSPAALQSMLTAAAVAAKPRVIVDLRSYLLTDHGSATIGARMDAIVAWARRYRIPPDHILMGEFATLLSDKPAYEKIRADNLRWIAAMRREAERRRFAWAYWGVPGPGSLNYDPATRYFRADALTALGLVAPQ